MRILMLMMLVLFLPVTAMAQLGMRLLLNRGIFMEHEPILACVSIRNDSGRTLVFGKNPKLQGFLLFEVTDQSGKRVGRSGNADLSVDGLVLKPGELRNLIVPVNFYYRMDKLGTYRIHAYVSHNMLPNEYKSNEVKITVERGYPCWQRTVGIPDTAGEKKDKVIQSRTYTIRMLTESVSKYFYLVIEDKENIYAVLRLGKQLGREMFQADVDMLSRLHILIPVASRTYQYLSFDLEGRNLANEYRKVETTIPSLLRDSDTGKVFLAGGRKAVPGIDFKNPAAGKISAAEIDRRSRRASALPTPPKASGIVDIGEDKKE